ncbi:CaiB/BaiF CoA transferase family protein [Castellaniella sp.]|uniref:CaiB/BaiF CoA transferase family protein n=1 Tax=Castellaniella sp. TaxID=1955812 RepID=UPI003C75659D
MKLLDGVKVLSFNHFLAGPLGAQILADLGADVIAVEPLTGAFQRHWAVANHFVGRTSVNHLTCGRNKRSVAVDLKNPEGLEIVKKLVLDADVVMENFRPGTMDKLGLGYEDLRALNPGLIYAVCTGYGFRGPYKDRPGQDMLLQAMSGLMMRTGHADGPPIPTGSPIIDHHAAALYANGILAALYAKARTGKGRMVEVSLLQAAIDLQIEPLTAWLNGAESPQPRAEEGIASWCSAGPYGPLATADGHLVISMSTPDALGKALGIDALVGRPDSDSFARREEVTRAVAARLREKPTDDWLPILTAHRIWHAPVVDYDTVKTDPQLAHLGAFETMAGIEGEDITLVMHPALFDGAAPPVRILPQALGAQTREVLRQLGYDETRIQDLLLRDVVRDTREAANGGAQS